MRDDQQFAGTLAFIEQTEAVVYSQTSNPQLVEVVAGKILSGPTKFEACIELQRVAEKMLSPVESCVLHALIEGRITEQEIHPARLESIRAKCLREWRRVGLLPLNKFLTVSQKVLNAENADAEQRRSKRDSDRREAEKQQRIESAKLLRMRPRDRKRVAAKQRKEAA